MRFPNLGRRLLISLCVALLPCAVFGCGGPKKPTAPGQPVPSPLSTLSGPDKPKLSVVRRDGDPAPALAAAVVHDAKPAAALAFAAAVAARLEAKGYAPSIDSFVTGLVVAFRVSEEKRRQALEDLRQALSGPADTARATTPPPFDPCVSKAGDATEIRVGVANTALAMVGPDDFVDAMLDAYDAGSPWPNGAKPAPDEQDEMHHQVQPARAESIWLALRTPGVSKLIDAARLLNAPDSLLNDQLAVVGPGFTVTTVHTSARPRGGCLALELRPDGTASSAQVARAGDLSLRQLDWALRSATETPFEVVALTASSALEAARRTAWQGLHAPDGQSPSEHRGRLFHWLTTDSDVEQLQSKLDSALVERATTPSLETEVSVEQGQGQLWFSLSSQCPVAHEGVDDAGFTALSLETVAMASPAATELEVSYGVLGPALVVHGPALTVGDTERLARDLARALYQVLAGGASNSLPKPEVPAPVARLLEVGAGLVTDGHPSELLPRGTSHSIAAARPELLRQALQNFLASPLRLSVLANVNEDQAQELQQELQTLLSPIRDTSLGCPKGEADSVPGEYTVAFDEASGASGALLLFPFGANALPEARWFAHLLSRPGGLLQRDLGSAEENTDTGLVSIEAVALGTQHAPGALVFRVQSNGDPQRALLGVRRALKKLKDHDPAALAVEGAAGFFATQDDGPIQRLDELAGRDMRVPTLESLGAFVRETLDEKHLVAVVAAD